MDQAAAASHNFCPSVLLLGPHASTLIREHLDPSLRFALFRTSKAARYEVLISAESVKFRLVITEVKDVDPENEDSQLEDEDTEGAMDEESPVEDEDAEGAMDEESQVEDEDTEVRAMDEDTRVRSAMSALTTALTIRGERSLKLVLELDCEEFSPMTRALDVLKDAGAGVHQLGFCLNYELKVLPTSILEAAARAFPNLKSLECGESHQLEAMPHPSLLPHLTTLSLDADLLSKDEAAAGDLETACKKLLRSIEPYLSHLQHLNLNHDSSAFPEVVPSLFTPATISHTLQTLKICAGVDDALLGLLLAYAPALEVLEVWDMVLESNVHAHTTCRWRKLTCTVAMDCTSIAYMPSPSDGIKLELVAHQFVCRVVTAEVELKAMSAASRMEWQGGCYSGTIELSLGHGTPVDEQPAALRVMINVLRAFATQVTSKRVTVEFTAFRNLVYDKWVMSAPLMHELWRLPGWGSLLCLRSVQWLPQPSVYAALIGQLPASFHALLLGRAPNISQAHLESICFGAMGRGRPEQPLNIRAINVNAGVIESIQQTLDQLGLSDHVVVSTERGLTAEVEQEQEAWMMAHFQ